jgi:hypothetical protein
LGDNVNYAEYDGTPYPDTDLYDDSLSTDADGNLFANHVTDGTSGSIYLNVFFDLNDNGNWETSEWLIKNLSGSTSAGKHFHALGLNINDIKESWLRLMVTDKRATGPFGFFNAGEVEDHFIPGKLESGSATATAIDQCGNEIIDPSETCQPNVRLDEGHVCKDCKITGYTLGCSDGIDNDNDGLTDCNDPSCKYNEACLGLTGGGGGGALGGVTSNLTTIGASVGGTISGGSGSGLGGADGTQGQSGIHSAAFDLDGLSTSLLSRNIRFSASEIEQFPLPLISNTFGGGFGSKVFNLIITFWQEILLILLFTLFLFIDLVRIWPNFGKKVRNLFHSTL